MWPCINSWLRKSKFAVGVQGESKSTSVTDLVSDAEDPFQNLVVNHIMSIVSIGGKIGTH